MKRTFSVMVGATVLAMFAGTANAQDATVQKGMQVFVAQKCTQCHSIAGKGSKKGALDDVGSNLSPAEIKEWILDPVGMAKKRKPASTRKPPMKKKALPAEDVDALVTLLGGLKKA